MKGIIDPNCVSEADPNNYMIAFRGTGANSGFSSFSYKTYSTINPLLRTNEGHIEEIF